MIIKVRRSGVMNVLDSKDYLEKQLPGISVNIIEYYKEKPNNRYEFSKSGISKPVALLLSQKLALTNELLDDIAVAVNRKFNEAPIETPAPAVAMLDNEHLDTKDTISKPSELEKEFYESCKLYIAKYEREYPMT